MKKLQPIYFFLFVCFIFSCNQQAKEEAVSTVSIKAYEKPATKPLEKPETIGDPIHSESVITNNSKKKNTSNSYQFEEEVIPENQIQNVEIITPSNISPSSPASAEAILNLKDLYRQLEKPVQTFTFSGQTDTLLIASEGTKIRIPADALVSEKTGKQATGPINLEVKEYYTMADILLANLSTKSNFELLETGGMIQLEAFAGKEKLKLKKGEEIELSFPTQAPKPGMQLFTGAWKEDKINWLLDEPATSESIKVKHYDKEPNVAIKRARFPNGDAALIRYYKKFPFPANRPKRKKKAYGIYKFLVLEDGTITDITVTKSVDPVLDKSAVYMISKMPKWKPATVGSNRIDDAVSLEINFNEINLPKTEKQLAAAKATIEKVKQIELRVTSENTQITNKEGRELRYLQETKDFNKVASSTVSYYALNSTKLGWINCDRFINSNQILFTYNIPAEPQEETEIKLVFHKYKAIMNGIPKSNNVQFSGIPKNEKVTVVAIKKASSKLYLATKEMVTSAETLPELAYQEVTLETLKEEMVKLNKLQN